MYNVICILLFGLVLAVPSGILFAFMKRDYIIHNNGFQ